MIVPGTGEPLLSLSAVTKRYGRTTVLADVTHDFAAGLTLLIGPSGAGKSTLLRMAATAERPSSGTMAWTGASLPRARRTLRATLGYAPQAVELPDELTAREFAAHMAALKGLNAVEADAQFLHMAERVGLHADANRRIATFSGGMRRRLITLQALLGDPRMLALDEPTAELDRDTADAVSALILERAERAVVLMTTHLADDLAPAAAAVLRVADGRVEPA